MHDIFDNSNRDILDLLRLIIKPEYLQERGQGDASCFKKDAKLGDVRKQIEVVGCNMRAESNKKYYELLAKVRYNDSIDLEPEKRAEPSQARLDSTS